MEAVNNGPGFFIPILGNQKTWRLRQPIYAREKHNTWNHCNTYSAPPSIFGLVEVKADSNVSNTGVSEVDEDRVDISQDTSVSWRYRLADPERNSADILETPIVYR
jgi:hypothetical protein